MCLKNSELSTSLCGKAVPNISSYSEYRSRSIPLDLPESIKELALRPRLHRLLLRDPVCAPFLISLLRRMIGVSANGRAILVASKVISTGGAWSSPSFDLLGRVRVGLKGFSSPLYCFVSNHSRGFLFLIGRGSSSTLVCSLLCRKLRLFSTMVPVVIAEVGELNEFFLDLAFGTNSIGSLLVSSCIIGSTGSGFDFLERVRLNVNPSSSSSYATGKISLYPRGQARFSINIAQI